MRSDRLRKGESAGLAKGEAYPSICWLEVVIFHLKPYATLHKPGKMHEYHKKVAEITIYLLIFLPVCI